MDNFPNKGVTLLLPVEKLVAVTPDDDTDLAEFPRGIYIGGAGDVKVNDLDANTVTLKDLAVGVIHPIRARRIHATGTTATDIVAVY